MFRKPITILFLLVIILVPLGWIYIVKYESEVPKISLNPDTSYLGKSSHLTLSVEDQKSGIRKVEVKLRQGAKEATVLEKSFPMKSWLSGGEVRKEQVPLVIEPDNLGIGNGKATLTCSVWDYSLREWFHGSRNILQKEVTIDTVPPVVSVISNTRYLNEGGAGVVCFTATEKIAQDGVQVGEILCPGVPMDETRNLYLSYFFVPRDSKDLTFPVVVKDLAGNEGKSTFFYRIKKKKFRHDRITLSDSFLELIAPRFLQNDPGLGSDPLAVFLKVNEEMRKKNNERIREICRNSSSEQLWKGPFIPLPNGEARANFGDERTFLYNGKEVSEAVHLGLDLASLANSPIPAGNDGIVVFADYLGIYGNAVILDHGQGIFSLYGHMSMIKVKKGDRVEKGQALGNTGFTGLAVGDHLHFGMYVWGEAVNPLEWLDPNWVKKKVEIVLEAAANLK